MNNGQHQSTHPGLAGGNTLIRRLQAMIHGIANQVDQRIANLINNRTVQLGFLAENLQINFFA